jgi:hypothetical protein
MRTCFKNGFVEYARKVKSIRDHSLNVLYPNRLVRRVLRRWYSSVQRQKYEWSVYRVVRSKEQFFHKWLAYVRNTIKRKMGKLLAVYHYKFYLYRHCYKSWKRKTLHKKNLLNKLYLMRKNRELKDYLGPSICNWKRFLQRRRLLFRVFSITHTLALENDDIMEWDINDGRRLERVANIRYREQFHLMRTVIRKWGKWTCRRLTRRWQNRSIRSLRRLSLLRKMTFIFYEWRNIIVLKRTGSQPQHISNL